MNPSRTFLTLVLSSTAAALIAHPGGLDSDGGHTDRRTGQYHYHRGGGGGGGSSRESSPRPATPKYPASRPATPTYPKPTPTPQPAPAPRITVKKTTTTPRIEVRTNVVTQPMGYPEMIASLIDPEKLATLGERGANSRVQKAVALIEQANLQGFNTTNVVQRAVEIAGYTNTLLAQMTRDSLLINHRLAQSYGVFTAQGFDDMRRGQCPKIVTGPHTGDELSVDHIVPRAKYPQFDNVIANLEFMPLRENMRKNDSFGPRQAEMLERFKAAQLFQP